MKKITLDIEPNTSTRPTVRRCVVCKQNKPEGQFRPRDEKGQFCRNICNECWDKAESETEQIIVKRRKR